MLGAEITLLSTMIANGLPVFCCVTRAKRLPPWLLNVIETVGALVCGSNSWRASVSWSPEMIVARFTAMNGTPNGLPG